MQSNWFSGKAALTTYHLPELMGTKLRALYQRKKGRDLFDLYYAGQQDAFSFEKALYCFREYLRWGTNSVPSRKQFLRNLEEKSSSELFLGDTQGLLAPNIDYDHRRAFQWLESMILLHW